MIAETALSVSPCDHSKCLSGLQRLIFNNISKAAKVYPHINISISQIFKDIDAVYVCGPKREPFYKIPPQNKSPGEIAQCFSTAIYPTVSHILVRD